MGVLQTLNLGSLIFAALSLLYTIYYTYIKIKLRKIKEELVSKIISMLEQEQSNEQIVNSLLNEGFRKEDVGSKMYEIRQLMNLRQQQNQ
jgi:hypothetical protein